MTPTDYAADELTLWEQALREQHELELQLETAYRDRQRARVLALRSQLHTVRIEASLLLADAVKVKCTFRDHTFAGAAASTTQSGELLAQGKP